MTLAGPAGAAQSTVARRRRPKTARSGNPMDRGKYLFIIAFVLPAVLIYGVFTLSPYFQAIYYSFTDWSGLGQTFDYVGLDNYRRMFDDPQLLVALRNNFILLICVPILTLALGLFLASMLNVGGRGRGGGGAVSGVWGSAVYKVVYFFPQVLSVAIVAVLFKYVFSPAEAGGVLNTMLGAVGLDSLEQLWLGDETWLIWVIVVVMMWSFVGFFVVLFSAAMQSIPRDIYEAALIDGSNRWTTFRKITVPLVWDTVQVSWVYLAIQAMDGFALVHIIHGINGGPGGQGDVLGVAVYRAAFQTWDFGYASTIGVLLLALTMTITLLFMRILRRERVELG